MEPNTYRRKFKINKCNKFVKWISSQGDFGMENVACDSKQHIRENKRRNLRNHVTEKRHILRIKISLCASDSEHLSTICINLYVLDHISLHLSAALMQTYRQFYLCQLPVIVVVMTLPLRLCANNLCIFYNMNSLIVVKSTYHTF